MASPEFLLGEFRRTLDERYRLSVPADLADQLTGDATGCILAKERPGALSLWKTADWQDRLDSDVRLFKEKIAARKLEGRLDEVQMLGRLLSTRQKQVDVAGRGRLVIPEGFREFLAVQPGGEVLIVGAAVCVEIWRPDAWIEYLNQRMPEFRKLLNELSG